MGMEEGTHYGDDLVLDDGRERDQLEVEGEVELRQIRRRLAWSGLVLARPLNRQGAWGGGDRGMWLGRRGETYGAHEERDGDGLLRARHGCVAMRCFEGGSKGVVVMSRRKGGRGGGRVWYRLEG